MPERLAGRAEPLARLRAALARAAAGERSLVLVTGEAGIGKTALVRAATEGVRLTGWGTCLDDPGAPGYWPWTRAVESLARVAGPGAVAAAGDDAALLAPISAVFGPRPARDDAAGRHRVLLMDAVARWLDRVAADEPVVVVLDDVQWADESSLALLEFVARQPAPARLCLVACYRRDELPAAARDRLAGLGVSAEHVELAGLDRAAVAALVEDVAGAADAAFVEECWRRAGGHPVFTRELALLAPGAPVPAAVRDAIDARVRRLPEVTRRVLGVAALAAHGVAPGVVARALGADPAEVEAALPAAFEAGLLARDGDRVRFAHDLYRETVLAGVPDRPALHRALGVALEHRATSGGDVRAADLARHFTAALRVDGPARAARWALAAAADDRRSLAFTEAAGHLRRWRAAVADADVAVEDAQVVDVLLAEADALARAGSVVDARGLLRVARDLAGRADRPDRLARVALAVSDLGARFATRRDDVVRELEEALARVAGTDRVLEARVTAALARKLQHSVASDRPRAGPLSERALAVGRATGDDATLVSCLLARHDVLWTPGSAAPRADVAREVVAVAERLGDDERRAEGLLLLANALLEQGSAAFLPALESALDLYAGLGQPRHRYVAETRRAALALLRGDLADAAVRIEDAAALGERIREPDTGNVRMSQRLELVRAGGDPGALVAFAAEAVAHWVAAPVHAYAVAGGFLARAGDLDGARRHVATVLDLGTWQADRSYLWSVFVRELAVAAIALDDRTLCANLLAELRPLAAECGVNGAVVAFAGSHAHTAYLLAEALGEDGTALRDQAVAAYTRLGATGWLASLAGPAPAGGGRSFVRRGRSWEVTYGAERATVPHAKGLADLATLLAQPDRDVHVLELYGSGDRSAAAGEVLDRTALAAYRQRLADLDADLAEAEGFHDDERRARLAAERDALLGELRAATVPGGGARSFASYPAERARKAVAARIRDAIRRLALDAPGAAAHLDAAVVTGMHCRYRADGGPAWDISPS